MKKYFLFFCILLLAGYKSVMAFPSVHETDSLQKMLADHTIHDTIRVNTMALMAFKMATSAPLRALPYARTAIGIAKKINYTKGLADALNGQGIIHKNLSNYDSALYYYMRSLELRHKIKDRRGIAVSLNNIANVYDFFFNDRKAALNYYLQSLEIKRELNDRKGVASSWNNIGILYTKMQQFDTAHYYLSRALAMQKSLGNTAGLAHTVGSIADLYVGKKQYDTALVLYEQSFRLHTSVQDYYALATNLRCRGEVYIMLKQYQHAHQMYKQGLAYALRMHAKDAAAKCYYGLAVSSELLNQFRESAAYYRLANVYKDSVLNENVSQHLTEMRNHFELDSRDREIAHLSRETRNLDATHERDLLIRNFLIAAFCMALTMTFFIYRSVKKTRSRNQLLLVQQQQLTAQRDILKDQTLGLRKASREIQQQHDALEEKTQSLQRAHREIMAQRDDLAEKTLRLEAANEEILRQKEEIMAQRDNIEEQHQMISVALAEIELLSKVGKQVTATLDFETSFVRLYEYVSSMMNVESFSVMIYQGQTNSLEEVYALEKGERLPVESIPLEDDTRLAVICARDRREILINDFDNEYHHYVPAIRIVYGEKPSSLIYLPLMVEEKIIGVITVQSFQKNAYSDYIFNLMKTLAAYTAIALDNANAYRQISEQKEIIDDRNRNITDSIRYAETMQKALLPDEKLLQEKFAAHFMLYLPRDIVSGDFYWFTEHEGKIFIAVVDCTGHGVPGAFMSLIGVSLFNDIIKQRNISDPVLILEELHRGIRAIFKQESKANNDGMDVCLCSIEPQGGENFNVVFAGAKRPLLYLKKGTTELQRIKGGYFGIGGWDVAEVFFTSRELKLQKGDTLYLTTDGLVDQDNPNRDKFGSHRLKNLLQQSAGLSLSCQHQLLREQLQQFMGNKPQRDDITVLGVRL